MNCNSEQQNKGVKKDKSTLGVLRKGIFSTIIYQQPFSQFILVSARLNCFCSQMRVDGVKTSGIDFLKFQAPFLTLFIQTADIFRVKTKQFKCKTK